MFNKIKNFMYRGVHGWCPEDTWSLDTYLSKVISESCKYLADTTHGFPHTLTFKKWKRVLNQISEGIIAPNGVDDGSSGGCPDVVNYPKELGEAYKKQHNSLVLFVKYFNDLWD